MARAALIVLAWIVATSGLEAQPEVVPVENRVYEWLADQRVAGHLPEYRHETLPTDRAAVRRHLDSLAVRAERLGPSGRYWLDHFRREFFEPLDRVHSYVGDGRADLLDPDAERTWAYVRDDDWRGVVYGEGLLQGRRGQRARGPSTRRTGPIDAGGVGYLLDLTFEASYRNRIGFYTSTFVGHQLTGDTNVLSLDPSLAPTYFVAADPMNVDGQYDQTSASVRVVGGPFSAEIANQRIAYGPNSNGSLLLSDHADYVPSLRLGLRGRSVTYEFLHAALGSRPRTVLDDDGTAAFFEAPQRFLGVHRLDVQPTGWFSFAFTEMVVYGRRGPELAYLNPLFPFTTAEVALQDRDNNLFALEATLRPATGVEAYGTWLADDISSTFAPGDYATKMAFQGGVRYAAPALGTSIFGEYVVIYPYTYTHRFQEEGIFFNSYVHNGFGLGHPLGPNADQWSAGVRTWLPLRAQAQASVRWTRKGRNPVDPVTGEITNVGADEALGTAPPDGNAPFLAGDLFQGPGLRAGLDIEPARGVALRFFGDVQWWRDRDPDSFFRLSLAVRP